MTDTIALIQQSHRGDQAAREQLVEENMGLVHLTVKRFWGRGNEMEDLIQIGTIGLIKAIDNFDTSFQVKFSTYAVPMIAGEIKRFLRDDGMVKVSRSIKENGWRVKKAAEQLSQRLNREPTLQEIAKETELQTEDILIAMEAQSEVESIYKSVHQSDGSDIFLVDKLSEEKDEHEEMMNRLMLNQMIEELKEEEQKLIRLRYYENVTQMEVARQLGISQVQVSRMEKKILLRMRNQFV